MTLQDLERYLFPVHREGWKFITLFVIGTLLLFLVNDFLGVIGVVLTVWCVFFFRDPVRQVPDRFGLLISPADGIVEMIAMATPPAELGLEPKERLRISIFMSPFNVHVNRAPIASTIGKIAYHPGAFFNAALDKASEQNERNSLQFIMEDGRDIIVVQIAGFIARRILCWSREGQALSVGERFGMIRFGSRVDVYLPDGAHPLVTTGQTMVAGETVLADLTSVEEPRSSTAR